MPVILSAEDARRWVDVDQFAWKDVKPCMRPFEGYDALLTCSAPREEGLARRSCSLFASVMPLYFFPVSRCTKFRRLSTRFETTEYVSTLNTRTFSPSSICMRARARVTCDRCVSHELIACCFSFSVSFSCCARWSASSRSRALRNVSELAASADSSRRSSPNRSRRPVRTTDAMQQHGCVDECSSCFD